MNRKKIFGISATVLMILIAMGPVINGIQLDKKNETKNFLNTSNMYYDLKVVVEDCHYIGIDESGENVIYNISYHYENEGGGSFPQQELVHIIKCRDHEIKRWRNLVGNTKSRTRSNTIKGPVNIPAYEEEYIAGKEFYFGVIANDDNPDNDIDIAFGEFGWEGKDYAPTYAQIKNTMLLLSERLKNYETTEMGGLFTRLKERLGWVYTFYSFSTAVMYWGLKLIQEALIIGALVAAEVYIVLDWLVEFETFLTAPNVITLDAMLKDTSAALGAVIAVYEMIILHEGIEKVIDIWQDFSNAVNATIDYLETRPWFNTIDLVFGDLDGKNLGSKTVHVKCRTEKNNFVYNYDFDDLDPEAMGEKAWQMHDCTVTASANKYKTKQSPKIVSWVFSEGKMRYDFYLKPEKSRHIFRERLLDIHLERLLNRIKILSMAF